jgi:hypothetical protein
MQKTIGLAALAAAFVAIVLTGCAGLRVDAQADKQGRAAFNALQRGDWRALEPQLSPVIAGDPQLQARLEQVRRIVPLTAPVDVRVAHWQRSRLWGADSAHATSITYLYTFAERSLMVNVVFDRREGGSSIAGLHVAPVAPELLAANRFGAPGKSLKHFGFLALCVASGLLMVAVAVSAVRTPALEARWLWALLAFAGIGTVWMNWTTGATGADLASAQLIGLGATQSLPPLTPWIVRMTVPVGAVVVLVRVWMLRRRSPTSPTT